jgi:hypothetical protein
MVAVLMRTSKRNIDNLPIDGEDQDPDVALSKSCPLTKGCKCEKRHTFPYFYTSYTPSLM